MLETFLIISFSLFSVSAGILVHLKVMHLEYVAYKKFLEVEEKYINDRISK